MMDNNIYTLDSLSDRGLFKKMNYNIDPLDLSGKDNKECYNILSFMVDDYMNKNPDEFVGMDLSAARTQLFFEILNGHYREENKNDGQ